MENTPTTQPNFTFSDCIITRKWEGKEQRISPFGVEFNIYEDYKGEIYEFLIGKLKFEELKQSTLKPFSYEADFLINSEIERIEKLKEQYKDTKVKITIKIELEKYE